MHKFYLKVPVSSLYLAATTIEACQDICMGSFSPSRLAAVEYPLFNPTQLIGIADILLRLV
jgi:hypothetical protein